MSERWLPHLTVAALIEEDGRFLMVEEQPDGRAHVLNQPAGHVEEHESLFDAVIREVREETQRHFTPAAITGIYRWYNKESGITYLRVVFCGSVAQPDLNLQRDPAIMACRWYTLDGLHAVQSSLRSPMVLRAIEDYLAGQRLPLELIQELNSERL